MKVYNNLLHKDQFKMIQDNLMSPDFSWYYNQGVNTAKDAVGVFQFTHCFYSNNVIGSNYFSLIKPYMDYLQASCLLLLQ